MHTTNQGIIELPKGYIEEDCIYDDSGNQVTNGIIRLLGYHKVIGNNSSQRIIQVRFLVHSSDLDSIVDIPVDIIDSRKLSKYIPAGFFFLSESETKRLRLFQNLLKITMEELPLTEIFRVPPGYSQLPGGIYVYGLGNMILNPKNTVQLTAVGKAETKCPTTFNLPYFDWIKNFFKQSEQHPALFISATVSLIRPLLRSVGINDIFALYVVGQTGNGKSEYAKLLTDIFKNHDSCRSLSSRQIDLFRSMSNYTDFLFLIDDLNITASRRVKDKKEATLSELIQQISSGGTIEYSGESFQSNVMLLITAEYVLKNSSSVNRCLIIELEKSFDSEGLTWLQEHQSYYICFLLHYITWICRKYPQLTRCIYNWKSGITPLTVEEPRAYAGFPRIQRTYEILQLATELYLLFLKEVPRLSEPLINRLRNQIISSINNCITNTLKNVKQHDSAKERHYVEIIIYKFVFKGNSVADSYKAYQKARIKDRAEIKETKFFREGDCYCITGDDLLNLFKERDSFPYIISKQAISRQLKFHGLLKIRGGENSFPLNGTSGKTRYYHLYVSRIIELMEEMVENFDVYKQLCAIPELRK